VPWSTLQNSRSQSGMSSVRRSLFSSSVGGGSLLLNDVFFFFSGWGVSATLGTLPMESAPLNDLLQDGACHVGHGDGDFRLAHVCKSTV